MRVADFFCGAGGFSEGFRQAGFDVVLAVDIWKPAINTYQANKPKTKTLLDDIVRLANLPEKEFHNIIPDTEIIIGSPPCIAFSNSNKSGNGDKELGINLVNSYLRIIARKKFKKNSILRYWILENVPNIEKYLQNSYSANDLGLDGDFILTVKNSTSGVYNAKYFGVPSNRNRYFCGEFPEPVPTNDEKNVKTLDDVLKSLFEPLSQKKDTIIQDFNYPSLELPVRDVSDHQYLYRLEKYDWATAKRLKQDHGYMGRMAFPENENKPARTIMATMSARSRESMIIQCSDGSYRLPTVREIASLMSFPIEYRFYGVSKSIKYRLVGNAVPPKLAYAFAIAILKDNNNPSPQLYQKIYHDKQIQFIDLNYKIIKSTPEKRKKISSKYSRHIPNLIVKSYRIELNNHKSIFDTLDFKWEIVLHYGQGKQRAKKYFPQTELGSIDTYHSLLVDKFIHEIKPQLCDSNELQNRFCLTSIERVLGLMGPDELLESISKYVMNNIETDEFQFVNIDREKRKVPFKIIFAHNLLFRVLTIVGGLNDGCANKKRKIIRNSK